MFASHNVYFLISLQVLKRQRMERFQVVSADDDAANGYESNFHSKGSLQHEK